MEYFRLLIFPSVELLMALCILTGLHYCKKIEMCDSKHKHWLSFFSAFFACQRRETKVKELFKLKFSVSHLCALFLYEY